MISIGDLIIRLCNCGFGTIEAARRFFGRPDVQTISTSELRSALSSDDVPPVLVDARSAAEQNVSRIPGAITQQEYEAEMDTYAGRRVAVYCTVGGRSYLYARKLVAAGVDAANYRDGILGWCRKELPLESPEKQPTIAVHPYWRVFHVPDQYDVKT
ncbi:rhodanese-like domain-containing protein [Allorhodopirellula solitaria]|uniref:Rhodanese domain-containing protein n=1 Tax=Allorhodopirellula solitaria TaxID=2527987 RepID=A0A5C5WQN0_9BACT|nr:rhodanese-like domain-containing protein [Allorhodopirellula solitaria]TWT52353.1 hypothetical protein CA85_50070 [Allorhodopirellula solitaria]